MKKLGEILTTIGIVLFFIAPLFQEVDAYIKNDGGDGDVEYGDNFIFRNILGVKTLEYIEIDGYWDYEGTELQTTPWMQKIGLDTKIYWGYSDVLFDSNSDDIQIVCVIVLRWIIKLSIPLIFFIPGYILKKKYS